MKIFIGLCLIILTCSQSAIYKKVIVEDKDALCLDGTPGVYYISEGKSLNKFLIYFQGGAWCGSTNLANTLQSCYRRSKTNLGSSKNYPQTMNITQGIMSNNAKNNFSEYTKIFIKYCDGSGHQGTKSNPIEYKDTKLYFRGNNLTISKFNDLQNKYRIFSNSSQIIVSGRSAGGLATYVWSDYVRNRSLHKNVVGVPDSGIFLDAMNIKSKEYQYRISFENLFKLSNVQIDPPTPQCIKVYKNETYKCMLVEYLHKYIQTPIFAIQSLYDTWSIPQILGIQCLTDSSLASCTNQQRNYIEQYHKNTSRVLIGIGDKLDNGYWAPVCAFHVYTFYQEFYSYNFTVSMNTNNTIQETLIKWRSNRGGSHRYMDYGRWPDNRPCSGLVQSLEE